MLTMIRLLACTAITGLLSAQICGLIAVPPGV
jgi:hypothetical protein